MKTELTKALNKTKSKIIFDTQHTFVASVLFSMRMHIDDTLDPPTAATDGLNLYVHPDFFMGLSEDERIGLFLHETWHVCMNHMYRGRDLDHKRYNAAADYVINLMLTDHGVTLPPKALLDKKYKDMSTLQVYEKLKNEPESKQGGAGQQDIRYSAPGKGNSQAKQDQMTITNAIIKGMQQAKLKGGRAAGNIPGEIKVMIDELLNPKLPWTAMLSKYVNGFTKDDYSYRRPNRRYMPEFYLPSMYSESLQDIIIGVDTSGSVTDKQFTAFIGEMYDIKNMLNPETMTVLDFDTSIKAEHILVQGEDLSTVSFHGRGGTDVKPVLKYIKKKAPVVAIIFTDGYFPIREKDDPGCPVLWIIIDNTQFEPPFGEVIEFDV